MKEIFKRFRELIEFYKNDVYHQNYFLYLYAETVWYYGDAEDILDYEYFIGIDRQQPYEIFLSQTLYPMWVKKYINF